MDIERLKHLSGIHEAQESECLTPDTHYGIHTSPHGVDIQIKFPNQINLSAEDAEQLEINIHNALELALAYILK